MKISHLILTLGLLLPGRLLASSAPDTGPPANQQPSTANPVPKPPTCPTKDCPPVDPVVLSGGKLYYPAVDVEIPGLGRAFGMNLHFFRGYSNRDNAVGVLGAGWCTTLDSYLGNAGGSVPFFRHETGRMMYFTSGTITFPDGHVGAGWQDAGFTLEAVSGGDYELIEAHGLKYRFTSVGQLRYIEDPLGHRLTYNRNGQGQVTSIADHSGRSLSFRYYNDGKLSSMTDPLGRVWGYGYHLAGVWGAGMLAGVTGPAPLALTEQYYYDVGGNLVSLKNPRGNVTSYLYDAAMDRVTRMTHPNGQFVQFTYNISLGTSSMIDEDGKVWQYEYIGQGMVSNVIDPLNAVHNYQYNSAHELTEYRGPLYDPVTAPNRRMVYTWSNHNMTSVLDETGATKTFAYEPNTHEILSETDDNLHTVTLTKDTSRRVTNVQDGRGKNTGYTYDAPTGLVKTITDRRSKVTTFNYDAHGNQTSVVDADGKTWVFTYDTAGRRATAKTPLNHTTTYTYDVADRVTRVTDPMGKFWDYTYDAMGNLLTEKTPLAGTTTTYTYDTRDRRLTSKDPLNYTTTYAYNGRNLLTSVTDPLSCVTTYDYDNAGRRTKITQPPAAVGGAPIITEFTYNLAGELTSVKDAKTQITQFHWEPTTRRATQTFPDASTELSDYDGAGNLTTFTNRSGQAMAKAYNENNWLITQNCPTCGAGFSYDDEGNLTQVVDATAGTYAWTYDDLNRVLVSTQPGGTTGGAKTVGYTYDNAGRPLTLTYPDGTVVTYSHDSRGLMNYVSSPVFGTSIGYDDAMRRSSQITPGGFHGSYTYDNASRLTGLTWGHQNTQITSHTWNHNSVSDITSTTATNGLSGSRTYTYDQVNRLKGRTVSGSLNTAHPATTWNLDAVGNRTSTVVGGTTIIYGLNAASLNQYATVGASSLTYDTRGNLLTDGTRTLTYDTDNRLTQAVSGANTIGYLYDFAHRLALRTEGAASVRYIYDQNWNVLADLNGATGATLRKYIHGPGVDEVLAQIGSTTATTYYLTKDHLGSATALIRASDNALVQRYTYDEYGAVTVRDSAGTPTGAAPLTRYLFTGREYDATVALYHYRHRWYHPGLGRFVQPDPIGFEGGDVNWYAYVLNKPLNFTDAFGLEGDNDGVLPEQEVSKKELLKGFCDAIKKFAKDAWNRGGHPAATGMSRGVGSLTTGAVSVAAEGENIYGRFKNLLDRKNELKKAGQMDPEDW